MSATSDMVAYRKAYYQKNKAAILENQRNYRRDHMDEVIARNKRWRAANPEKWQKILDNAKAKKKEERAKARAERLAKKLAEQN